MEPNWRIVISTCLGSFTPDADEMKLSFVPITQKGLDHLSVWLNRAEVEDLHKRLGMWLEESLKLWAEREREP